MNTIHLTSPVGNPVEFEWEAHEGGFTLRRKDSVLQGTGTLGPDGEGVLRVGQRVVPFFAVRAGETVQVWLDGEVYEFRTRRPAAGTRAGAGGLAPGGEVTAPMPGRILQVHVRAGDVVSAQAPLLVMESMKMQLTLNAPAAGRVAQVACEAGQMVELGAVLARVEPEGTRDEPSP